ncbi:MAG: ferritin family protein [Candidatus Omnitrophica bacterium]|nr:ferritin family protein [Candidatus Omnitrophota bacterium]MCM8826158.1 ferritin family protein [Candidatus Omnitrophota bacterium]
MSNIFSPQEILRIAIKVEENGKKLYEILENKSKLDKLKGMWKYLKEQEDSHRNIFKQMLENVGDYIVYEFSPGEYDSYLSAIASDYVFTQNLIEEKIKDLFTSDIEAIDFGIYIEKQSILVYSSLRDYVIKDKQDVIGKVIDEEKNHLSQLNLMKGTISKIN